MEGVSEGTTTVKDGVNVTLGVSVGVCEGVADGVDVADAVNVAG